MIKRAEILKFKDKYIMYPINTIKDRGGIASSPYFIEENLSNIELAEKLIETLKHSIFDAPRTMAHKNTHKEYLEALGFKTMKALHDGSLNIGVFTREGNYHISPTENMGSKKGFQGVTKDRIIIPESSSIEELAAALAEAFEKSK